MERKKASPASAPQKLYRSIREVSDQLAVKPHVLRYWETQFPALRPKKNRAGNRIYRPGEVELLERIKSLLYDQRFTIEGARRLLDDERKKPAAPATAVDSTSNATPEERAAASVGYELGDLAAASAEIAGLRAALAQAEQALEEARVQLAARATRDLDRMESLAELRREMESVVRALRGEGLVHETEPATAAVLAHDGEAAPTAPAGAAARSEEESTGSLSGDSLLPAPGFA